VTTVELEMLMEKDYLPVIAPLGIGPGEETLHLSPEGAAAEVAIALGAPKLILLQDAKGLLSDGELRNQLTVIDLEHQLADGAVPPKNKPLVHAILRALAGGVQRVHVLDGRMAHGTIAELFTDDGVGTLVTAAAREDQTTEARRQAIRRLIQGRKVATQEDLRALLASQGFDVTQGTLSRDLARLGARRAPAAQGGTLYELPPEGVAPAPPGLLEALDPLVRGVRDNGALVVVHTTPGAAQAVALALDQARLPEVLGTIAGDDTVFVAPVQAASASRLTRVLQTLLRKGRRS
jgi:transcriptional regulator of arginine metabolism